MLISLDSRLSQQSALLQVIGDVELSAALLPFASWTRKGRRPRSGYSGSASAF
jgi:hypothetical protein